MLKTDEHLAVFECEKCHKTFTDKFFRSWNKNYLGRFVRNPYHTNPIRCPFCETIMEVDLRKKQYQHLKRKPLIKTEEEIK